MDPVSALVFAIVFGTAVWRAAWQAAADQARAEARRAAGAVRADLRARRGAAAARLSARLDAGRAAGPAYPMWWAWAGLRGASALRRAARQYRRPAEERRGPARPTTGPLGRILGAALRGAAYGAAETFRQWREFRQAQQGAQGQPRRPGQGQPGPQARGRPRPPAAGVCERCGAVTAVTALAAELTRHGRRARMCAQCRAAARAERRLDAEAAPSPEPPGAAGVVDAEIVDDAGEQPGPAGQVPAGAAGCARCGQELIAFGCRNPACPLCPAYSGPLAVADAPDPERFALPARHCADCGTQLVPSTWHARCADNADLCLFCALGYRGAGYPDGATREREHAELAAIGTPLDDRGEPAPMSPQAWARIGAEAGRIASAAAGVPAAAPDDSPPASPAGQHDQAAPAARPALPPGEPMSCNGEMHTQADWDAQAAAIDTALGQITASAENMLRCLTAKEASRSQMSAAAAWADQVTAVAARGREIVAEVNARQDPYVNAVQGAGGSDEVAVPDYYAEI